MGASVVRVVRSLRSLSLAEVVHVGPPRLRARSALLATLLALTSTACSRGEPKLVTVERSVYSLANGCFAVSARVGSGERYLVASADGTSFSFAARSPTDAARFYAKAADLGTFVLRDADGAFALAEDSHITRATSIWSDTLLNDDSYVSPAEWDFEASPTDATRFVLRNHATQEYVGRRGMTADAGSAVNVAMSETTDCTDYPELTVDATGTVARTHFDDGDLYGFVDAHSHLFTNFGFGGGGVFHGSPFHRLGVEHALPDCERFHGAEGRRDLLGYFFGGGAFDLESATNTLLTAEVPVFDHFTAGYPEFTDWPNTWRSSTHQQQYYKWIERAYLGGLRLMVQHATSNEVLCELVTGVHAQDRRISCNEMVSAERIIDETYALERYVDAQSGGPGLGWFRVVTTPAEARQVVGDGKLAVVLGIETSNVMDCFLTPHPGYPVCDAARVVERLDHLYARGVRVLFPVHKFDNAFSAGDGQRGFIELGNFINSGHYSNFTNVCDATGYTGFDHGQVEFSTLNMPRVDYSSPAPVDTTTFGTDPFGILFNAATYLSGGPLTGEWCQAAGLTPLGETMLTEMMRRGMIIDIDHMPQKSYARAVQMLVAADYPASGTHGGTASGMIYTLGGISTIGLPRCSDPNDPSAVTNTIRARFGAITTAGGYPGQGFGFDLNGFGGGPRPRFGADAQCAGAQTNPITYPFTSYAGDIVFEQPELGNRIADFNTEGLVHLGLVPELIEDTRHMGVSDADLEPLFRSAEGYIRMWERAESRGAAIRAAGP